jgi:hypothetical protein
MLFMDNIRALKSSLREGCRYSKLIFTETSLMFSKSRLESEVEVVIK